MKKVFDASNGNTVHVYPKEVLFFYNFVHLRKYNQHIFLYSWNKQNEYIDLLKNSKKLCIFSNCQKFWKIFQHHALVPQSQKNGTPLKLFTTSYLYQPEHCILNLFRIDFIVLYIILLHIFFKKQITPAETERKYRNSREWNREKLRSII